MVFPELLFPFPQELGPFCMAEPGFAPLCQRHPYLLSPALAAVGAPAELERGEPLPHCSELTVCQGPLCLPRAFHLPLWSLHWLWDEAPVPRPSHRLLSCRVISIFVKLLLCLGAPMRRQGLEPGMGTLLYFFYYYLKLKLLLAGGWEQGRVGSAGIKALTLQGMCPGLAFRGLGIIGGWG